MPDIIQATKFPLGKCWISIKNIFILQHENNYTLTVAARRSSGICFTRSQDAVWQSPGKPKALLSAVPWLLKASLMPPACFFRTHSIGLQLGIFKKWLKNPKYGQDGSLSYENIALRKMLLLQENTVYVKESTNSFRGSQWDTSGDVDWAEETLLRLLEIQKCFLRVSDPTEHFLIPQNAHLIITVFRENKEEEDW